MYVLVKNGVVERYPYVLSDLKRDFPNTSFPRSPSPDQLEPFGVFPVYGDPEPAYDHATQVLVYPTPVYDAATNKWKQTSYIRDKTIEELDSYASAYKDNCSQAAQNILDSEARARGFDSILSAVSYVDSSNSRFASDAIAAKLWRDSVWTQCYIILNEVETGNRAIPTIEEFLSELPTINWPA